MQTIKPPSTRETINLVSDDEDAVIKKEKPSILPPESNSSAIPTSITVRKRLKKDEPSEETPCRPPSKKQKTPPNTSLPSTALPSTGSEPLLSSIVQATHPASPTQVPDSEGEDDGYDFLAGEDFNSDDISFDMKEILHSPTLKPMRGPVSDVELKSNIIPESPVKLESTISLHAKPQSTAPVKQSSQVISTSSTKVSQSTGKMSSYSIQEGEIHSKAAGVCASFLNCFDIRGRQICNKGLWRSFFKCER